MLLEGAIPPEKLTKSIVNHQSKTDIGGHSIFLGQVRADEVDGHTVTSITFTAATEMAEKVYREIREEVFEKYDLTCAHVHHSLGNIKVGELCFYVFTSSKRRKAAMEATEYFVEQIKARVPIFGKEYFDNEASQWKVNS